MNPRDEAADALSSRSASVRSAAGAVLRNLPAAKEPNMPYTTYDQFVSGWNVLRDMQDMGVKSRRVEEAIEDCIRDIRGRTRGDIEAEDAFSYTRWASRLDEALEKDGRARVFNPIRKKEMKV